MDAKFTPYSGPLSQAMFPQLSVGLLAMGLFMMASFLVYEVTSSKNNRNIFKEFIMAVITAGLLGFGTVFMMLWVGIYI